MFQLIRKMIQSINQINNTANDQTKFPLSIGQQAVWQICQDSSASATYNVATVVRILSSIDIHALRQTFQALLERHDALRTSIAIDTDKGQLSQTVHSVCALNFAQIDASDWSEDQLLAKATASHRELFDFATASLMRVRVFTQSRDRHLLLISVPHIVTDGWSMIRLMMDEIRILYPAFRDGSPVAPKPLRATYADHVARQERLLAEQGEELAAWWLEELDGALSPLALPTDKPRPPRQTFNGAAHYFRFSAELTAGLQTLAQQTSSTFYMTVLAGFQALLFHYSRQEQIIVGTPILGRSRSAFRDVFGYFTTLLPIRSDLSGNLTFADLLAQVKRASLRAYRNQRYPFGHIVQQADYDHDPSYPPLVQVAFNYLSGISAPGIQEFLVAAPDTDYSHCRVEWAGLLLEPYYLPQQQAMVDLTLELEDGYGSTLVGAIKYNADLFEATTIKRMVGHFETLLNGVVANPTQQIANLPVLTKQERHQIIHKWNKTTVDYGLPQTVHTLIEQQVAKTPDMVALIYEQEQLTYTQLNIRANRLAHHLVSLGVQPDTLVAIMMERSIEMVVSLLAVLKAGGAYVPIDPTYPTERIDFMLNDCAAQFVLKQAHLDIDTENTCVIDVDTLSLSHLPLSNLDTKTTPSHLAYVIYTSGSTGKPKGVQNEHRGIFNRICWMQQTYELDTSDVLLQKTPFSFDVSVWEFLWPFMTGASLVVAKPEGHKDPHYLVELIARRGVTTVHFVPSMLQGFLQADIARCTSLRRVICSGEVLRSDTVAQFYERNSAEIHNLYGPTEAAIDVSWFYCEPNGLPAPIPIGKPIANTQLLILDKAGQLVPCGVAGELCIGGVQVARGYLNRPKLTAERFTEHPEFGRLYRTGDLCRWLSDGNIEFLGRTDFQVKIRGFRIELGEIEVLLTQHPAVRDAAVVARQDNNHLVAYVSPHPETAYAAVQLLRMQQMTTLNDQLFDEMPNGMPLFYQNRSETDFMYKEIYTESVYLRHGIQLDEDACIFDVGANIGVFTLFAHQHCRNATLYAFEPILDCFELLNLNITLHGVNARTFNYGLASASGEYTFTYYPHVSLVSGRFADRAQDGNIIRAYLENEQPNNLSAEMIDALLDVRLQSQQITCQFKTLSQVILEEGITQIDLLKIDVEQSEQDILLGIADRDWVKIRQVVVEVQALDGKLATIQQLLMHHGFHCTIEQETMLEATGLYNLYAVRPKDQQRSRTSASTPPDFRHCTPEWIAQAIRQQLSQTLPEYMIPSAIVMLEEMPLAPNGKLDRSRLPNLDFATAQENYEPPRDEVEATLITILQDALQLPQVGIHDNFFRIGGDSILSIQVVSRAAKAGYTLRVADLFQNPTVAQMAIAIGNNAPTVPHTSQALQTGTAPLLPIQRWYLESEQADPQHFNQTILLQLKKPVTQRVLEKSIAALLTHHDALRFQYERHEAGWQQTYTPAKKTVPVQIVNLQAVDFGLRSKAVEQIGAETQASLNLGTGDLIRFVYFTAEGDNRLLIVIHHLVVDGVSWRILLEDLETLFAGGELRRKTSSYRDWGETLQAQTRRGFFDASLAHWLARTKTGDLPIKTSSATNTLGNSYRLTRTLTARQTSDLLHKLPSQHNVTLDATLLTALTETLTAWSKQGNLRVNIESHGRHELFDTIDLNRSVGWFTAKYPLTLSRFTGSAAKRLRYTQEQLRQVQDGGISFGALRDYHPDASVRSQLAALPSAQVVYNYLGQLSNTETPAFRLHSDSTGLSIASTFVRDSLLDSDALLLNNRLEIRWTVSSHIDRSTAESLFDTFIQNIGTLTAEACADKQYIPIPSDYPNAHLTFDALEGLLTTVDSTDIDAIYSLSPMQQGMFFHSQLTPDSGTYVEQSLYHIADSTFDPLRFISALQHVIDQHDNLRITLWQPEEGDAVQVVQTSAPLPITQHRCCNLSQLEYKLHFAELLRADRATDFDFTQPPLLRLMLVQDPASEYDLVLTFHHILLDRWSIALMWSRVLDAYADIDTMSAPPYQAYIHYIRQQPYDAAFWCDYLRGFSAPTPLPYETRQTGEGAATNVRPISHAISEQLQAFVRAEGITMNALVQTAWGTLLARYVRETDVVFGMVTSGRTAPIPDIDIMLGLLINTLPVRMQIDEHITGRMLLQQTIQTQAQLQQVEHSPLVSVQQDSELPAGVRLFNTLFSFQNTPDVSHSTAQLTLQSLYSDVGRVGYPLVALAMSGQTLGLALNYDTDRYDDHTINQLLNHWEQLLVGLTTQPDHPVLQLPLLTQQEHYQIIHEWNDTVVDYGPPQMTHDLIAQQVAKTPNAVALIYEQEQLTYAQLNERANQLAHHLISLGVQPDTLVALLMERSVEMVVAILAVLKAGGAYVPIDPSYPAERITFMLSDCASQIILKQSHLDVDIDVAHKIDLDIHSFDLLPTSNPIIKTNTTHLAYLIYTSGSTGKPKGVLTEHAGLFNRLLWMQESYSLNANDVLLQKTPYGFDVSVWEFLWPFMTGARLIVAKPDGHKDPNYLVDLIVATGVTTIHFVPSMFRVFLLGDIGRCVSLRHVICSGETLLADTVAQFYDRCSAEVHNLWGATEASIDSSWYRCPPEQLPPVLPIGKPIANTMILILDAAGQLVPCGVAGEAYIGSVQLARGYLNRPKLTAERFIKHPEFGRLYKTGDLCRWLPDGNIEFIGRTDFQVKIRGFRIELGEIENALLAQSGIREAAVLVREHGIDKRLVAYFVGHADEEVLRQQLMQRLPDYMIPATFVTLDAMPLNANGKLDRRALPAPDLTAAQDIYTPPRNAIEVALAAILQDVLQLPQVGIHDNFFRIGGDSILSIQVVSRAAKAGYTLQVADLFEHPTVIEMAAVIEHNHIEHSPNASQAVQTGYVPLLPIQRWFIETEQTDPHHFNQAVLLQLKRPLEQAALEQAIASLLTHHDALRFQYKLTKSGWQQTYQAPREFVPLQIVDLQAIDPNEYGRTIVQIGSEIQSSLNLYLGDLVRFVYFDATGNDALLIIIHHLAIDGVSWRILLEDLETLLAGEELPSKSNSYRDWVETLQTHTKAGFFDTHLDRWLADTDVYPLPLDTPTAANTMGNSYELTHTLSVAQTEDLLRSLPRQHDIALDTVLLTALVETLTYWSGHSGIRVKLESHGRPALFDTVTLNRTVGWFTSAYPKTLVRIEGHVVKRLRYIQEQLRQVEDGGISFSALRAYHPSEDVRAQLAALPPAQITYNYLGQFGNTETETFRLLSGSTGLLIADTFVRDTLLDSNAVLLNDQLEIQWTLSPQIDRSIADQLFDRFVQTITVLIAEACRSQKRVPIPSDYPNAKLTSSGLETLLSAIDANTIEAIYNLSPMQHGMLFHSRLAPASGTYIEQSLFHIKDRSFKPARFFDAIQHVINFHDSLRVSMWELETGEAIQIVHRNVQLPVTLFTWDNLSTAAYQMRLNELVVADRVTDFDLAQPPLLRLTLIEDGSGEYDLLFTFHHILLDRWSVTLLWSRIIDAYAGVHRPPAPAYQGYIRYVNHQSYDAPFWQEYLRGFYAPTRLPYTDGQTQASGTATCLRELPQALSDKLSSFARELGITVNTLVQAAWGLLLARYAGETDVIFGMVTSGRTAPIADIEAMIGLLINTLPLRIQFDDSTTGYMLFMQLAQTQVLLQQYEHSSLVHIQRDSELPAGMRLFDSLFLFQNTPEATSRSEQLSPQIIHAAAEAVGYPLVALAMSGECVQLGLNYDRAYYDAATIDQLLTHWQNLLVGLTSRPDQPVLSLPLLTPREGQQIAHQTNKTAINFGSPQPIHTHFEQQVAKTPNAIALICKREMLTYAQLNKRANRLAHYLITLGVRPNTIVAVMIDRSVDMVVALLAVVKAGGAYVPIDPRYPVERIAFMLTDCAAQIVIKQAHLELDSKFTTQIDIDVVSLSHCPVSNPSAEINGENLAYVIYTSGSTGQPKGISITHGNVDNFLAAMRYQPGISADDVLLAVTTISFDIAVLELFLPLVNGATVVVASDADTVDPDALIGLMKQHQVTIAQATPTSWTMLTAHPRWHETTPIKVLCGGEALPLPLAETLLAHSTSVWNMYGPTEATVWVSAAKLNSEMRQVTLAPPIANTTFYILDHQANEMPIGVVGELYIGGVQLARGYLNRPKLTAERFVEHLEFGRLYKTGDLCRWLPSGNIEFLGRSDFQVKVRGFRIELGEIQNVLLSQANVQEAIVIVHEDDLGKRLVAYFAGEAQIDTLRQQLAQQLPAYMLPATYVSLDSLPLTPNGKLDRRALPKPDFTVEQNVFVPPTGPIEQQLANIWADILDVTPIGRHDNFFQIGGHSLLATQVATRIRREFAIEIALSELFVKPTVAELALLIETYELENADETYLAELFNELEELSE